MYRMLKIINKFLIIQTLEETNLNNKHLHFLVNKKYISTQSYLISNQVIKQSARNRQLKIEHRQKEHSPSDYHCIIDCFHRKPGIICFSVRKITVQLVLQTVSFK